MVEMPHNNLPRPEDDSLEPSLDFLQSAREANESGDFLLSMYLYLAAFEKSSKEGENPAEDAVYGLKQAWALACANKERSMAEYIFELMEPYLTSEETTLCANKLQKLAFEKLEEFGLSREELEDMAQMLVEDASLDASPIVRIDRVVKRAARDGAPDGKVGSSDAVASDEAAAGQSPLAERGTSDEEITLGNVHAAFVGDGEALDYDSVVGYDSVIEVMHDFGIGMAEDQSFGQLVEMLNLRHGLKQRPALDSFLFRAQAREDANRFMLATLGELGVPAVHMRMEENFQGMPILCISTRTADLGPSQSLKDVFDNGGVLVLEDLDLWESPVSDYPEDGANFFMMQLTRGAREAVNLVRYAVEKNDVYVIATASLDGMIDDFFLDMLEPLSLIDIDFPNEGERARLWMDIAKNHPSIRSINKKDLVKYSANLARYDIYMATREAIEEAYKLGLITRKYQPVTRDNLFDKLAAYHPLESEEYSELEDEVIRDFQSDLDHIDDILNR